MLTSSKYNIFTETIRDQLTYTDAMMGILFLLCYTDTDNKFYVNDSICNMFCDTDYYTLKNIQNNASFKSISLIRNIRGENDNFPDKKNNNEYNYYLNKLFGVYHYNDLCYNQYDNLNHNVIFDTTIKEIFKNTAYDLQKIFYNNYNNIASDHKLILKNEIVLDHAKIKKFNINYYFINLPSYRLKDNHDIEVYDKIIDYIINHTPYKNLILISGDNTYKKYFYEKYGIITTEYYNQNDINISTKIKGNDTLYQYKSKGDFDSLITDYLYIQESSSGYIDFFALIRILKPKLEKILPKSNFVNWLFKGHIQGIDVIAILLKTKKLIEYAKN
jgi:hypothetical protein